MYYPEPSSTFFGALARLLLKQGLVDRGEEVTAESLDRALKAYIRNVVEEINNE